MPSRSINHLAVWVSAIVFFVWGYVWFGLLFKNQAMTMFAPPSQSAASMNPVSPVPYIVGFIMALVLAYGTATALAKGETATAGHGISFGLFMGIVFYASTTLTSTLFSGRPIEGWLLNIGWALIGFALVGGLIGAWSAKAPATV